MNKQEVLDLKEKGYVILKNKVSQKWIDVLSKAVDNAFTEHREVQLRNNNDVKTNGVALHVLLSNSVFIDFLNYLISIGLINDLKKNYFGANCILNSLSALNNLPNQPNFSAIIHRDLRFYSKNLPVMLNCLLMIDDFTNENGGTYLLPYSHLKEEKPSDIEFFNNSIQVVGKGGDLLIFDSNVWHSSAPNKTDKSRRAVPITISRSFMKQLLDYPRAIGYEKIDSLSKELQQFLGYHARVPASLDEWYQPEDKRFYKKNQD
jgi:ectoine hydroxylase-related dioxygenase (phytanoyl-CoA dioxygenase family)